MATGALVTGIISLITLGGCLILGIAAVVLGFMGRKRANEMNGVGAGAALAGIITGALGLIIGAILTVVLLTTGTWSYGDDFNNGINSDPPDGFCDVDRFLEDPDC